MRDGAEVIYQAAVLDEDWLGIRIDEPSGLRRRRLR
jgi:hypothetical protein